MPVNEFLGPYVPPQNLTMDVLKDVNKGKQGAFANTIADAGIKLNAAAGERAETAGSARPAAAAAAHTRDTTAMWAAPAS